MEYSVKYIRVTIVETDPKTSPYKFEFAVRIVSGISFIFFLFPFFDLLSNSDNVSLTTCSNF